MLPRHSPSEVRKTAARSVDGTVTTEIVDGESEDYRALLTITCYYHSSVLAALRTLQPRAVGILNRVVPLVSSPN